MGKTWWIWRRSAHWHSFEVYLAQNQVTFRAREPEASVCGPTSYSKWRTLAWVYLLYRQGVNGKLKFKTIFFPCTSVTHSLRPWNPVTSEIAAIHQLSTSKHIVFIKQHDQATIARNRAQAVCSCTINVPCLKHLISHPFYFPLKSHNCPASLFQ